MSVFFGPCILNALASKIFIFGMRVHFQHVYVKVEYLRHRVKVKVKVTGVQGQTSVFAGGLPSVERQSSSVAYLGSFYVYMLCILLLSVFFSQQHSQVVKAKNGEIIHSRCACSNTTHKASGVDLATRPSPPPLIDPPL